MTTFDYRVLALLVLAAVVFGAILLYHRRQVAHLELQRALQRGWRKVGHDRWQCPYCHLDTTGMRGRMWHQQDPRSPCAALQKHLEGATDALKEALPGAGWPQLLEGEPDMEDAE